MTPITGTARATKEMVGGKPVLRFERRLAHPPEKVWRAITDPDEVVHWFPTSIETELKPGAPMKFVMTEPMESVDTGEVLEVDPPKVFAFRWDTDVLRFELVPDGDGCRLYFTHTLGGGSAWGDERYAAQHAAGWDSCLNVLEARLDGREPPAEDEWIALNEAYVEDFGLAQGAIADGGRTIRFERVLVQPVDEVWAHLTTGATVGEPVPAALTQPLVAAGNVTAIEAPRWIEYAWLAAGEPAGHVGWELFDQEYGCRLVLTQILPADTSTDTASAMAGWQVHLELLVAALHGDTRPWPEARVTELTKMYGARLA